jgi:hypothetical protein
MKPLRCYWINIRENGWKDNINILTSIKTSKNNASI